jgi:hypothetical protein
MEFNISDRVRVKAYEHLPPEVRSCAIGKVCGRDGEIVDKLWSAAQGRNIYRIKIDGALSCSTVDFTEDMIDLISELEKKTYKYEVEILNNLVLVKLFECDEASKTEIARAHGHIIHEGVVGVAQAASYAMKGIYIKAQENNFKGE